MRGRLRATAALAAAGAVLGGAAAAAPAAKAPKPKTVRVGDNFFAPAILKVKPDTKVTWRWPTDVGDTHDVKLRKAPKGVKRFKSAPYAVGAKYSHTFKKPGRYELLCTFHATEMVMTVTVTKP
jgi:plastocyanin